MLLACVKCVCVCVSGLPVFCRVSLSPRVAAFGYCRAVSVSSDWLIDCWRCSAPHCSTEQEAQPLTEVHRGGALAAITVCVCLRCVLLTLQAAVLLCGRRASGGLGGPRHTAPIRQRDARSPAPFTQATPPTEQQSHWGEERPLAAAH